jgi:hypothetical protein
MAPLLRMNDQKIHTHYDGWTPSMVDDVYYNYADGVEAANNPLAATRTNGYDAKIRPRGCHPCNISIAHYNAANVLLDADVHSTALTDYWVITVATHLTEPILFLSPFISNPCVSNEAGFLGINNITFNFTVDNTLRRVFRTSNPWTYTYGFSNVANNSGWSNLKMLMNYLSVQPSQYAKISARNILPLLQYDRYLPNGGTQADLAAGATASYSSSNVALNQIPDTLMIFARVPMATQNQTNSDSFAIINSISVNFNNVSGILSSCSPQELWLLSQRSGSSQSYQEFIGKAMVSSADGAGAIIPTIGSILVLQPAFSFNLPEYLSSSSLGSYNLQFELNITNQSSVAYKPEIVVISITSGYMSIHQGSAQSFSGVLNKEMVLSAKDGSAVPRLSTSDYERLVGGVGANRGIANMGKYMWDDAVRNQL